MARGGSEIGLGGMGTMGFSAGAFGGHVPPISSRAGRGGIFISVFIVSS